MASANGQKQMEFTPVNYDGGEVPPEAPAGEWQAVCEVKKSKTQKDRFPKLKLNWKLQDTEEEEHKTFLGSSVTDFLVFFPVGHKAAGMAKRRLKKLCEALDIDMSTLPTGKASSWDDFAEFIEALDKQVATIWTVVKTDEESGESRTNVVYSRPGGSFKKDEEEDDDEDDEDDEDDGDDGEDEEEAKAAEAEEDEEEEEESPKTKTKAKTVSGGKAKAKKKAR